MSVQKVMSLNEAIGVLEYHNKWRRGNKTEMLQPKTVGEAIDVIVSYVKEKRNGGRTNL